MTRQPRKQRNQTRDAPLHERHSEVRATLTEELREEYGQRNVRVNTGDTVEVLRGDFTDHEGEVVDVDLREGTIVVEEVTVERADGEQAPRPLQSSNVRVTELNLDDERREQRLESEEDSA